MYNSPTTDDFKAYFFRDFPFGQDSSVVMDQDLMNAFSDADVNVNPALFPSQPAYTTGFLLLTAHFLVTNLRSSSQGIAGKYSWLQASKGVGSVSESFSIPQRILDNPEFAMLSQTTYGARFLYMVLPLLSGQMFSIYGGTNP